MPRLLHLTPRPRPARVTAAAALLTVLAALTASPWPVAADAVRLASADRE